MTLPNLTAVLSQPERPASAAHFPAPATRAMPGGWTRWFSRLGPLGARFYANERAPGVFECALWPANAHAGVDCQDWTSISIAPPPGFAIWAAMQAGNGARAADTDPLVIGTGAIDCFPTRRGFIQRFVLYKLGATVNPGVFLNAASQSIPDPVINFGPLNVRQPTVDRAAYRALAIKDLVDVRAAIAGGTLWAPHFPGLDYECGIMHPALGRWVFVGPSDSGNPGGGNPAGSDIRLVPGYDQTIEGALIERTRMDLVIAREVHAWDPITGDYLTVESFGTPSPQYSGSRSPWTSDGELPGFILPGKGPSACPWRAALEQPSGYDPAHLFRKGNPQTVASEYLQDPVAHDSIIDTAEEARLQFSDKGPVESNPGASWQPRNLRNFLAQQKPGAGGDCGRYRAEGAWFVVMAHRLKPRAEYKAWARLFQLWAHRAHMANGLWQWSTDPSFGLPAGVAGAQMFEQVYFSFCLAAQHDISPVAGTVEDILSAADALFINRKLPHQPDPWHNPAAGPVSFGPPHFLFVGNATTGVPYPHITAGKGSSEGSFGIGDPSNCEPLLALAYRLSGRSSYLRASCGYGWPAPGLSAKLAQLNAALDKNWTALLETELEDFIGVMS